jgi:CAAX protease family protein
MSDAPPNNIPDPTNVLPSRASASQLLFRSPKLIFAILRVCIYLALSAGITFGWASLGRLFLHGKFSALAPETLIASESALLAGSLAAAAFLSRLENRPFGDYGLPGRAACGKNFWVGAIFGLVEISVVVSAMTVFGAYHFGALAVHGQGILQWGLLWAVFFLIVGLYEEFAFRGYVQFTLAQGAGFWPAAMVLSIAFGAVHISNQGETWPGIAGIVLTGLLWCFALRRTGNLWFAVGMHASFDFGETFLYSVPDSGYIFPGHLSNATIAGRSWLTGGSAGPEASVFDFAMLILSFVVIDRLYPARKDPA